jgi:hypothetical protein
VKRDGLNPPIPSTRGITIRASEQFTLYSPRCKSGLSPVKENVTLQSQTPEPTDHTIPDQHVMTYVLRRSLDDYNARLLAEAKCYCYVVNTAREEEIAIALAASAVVGILGEPSPEIVPMLVFIDTTRLPRTELPAVMYLPPAESRVMSALAWMIEHAVVDELPND